MSMELDYDFFSVGKNIKPKQGRILISEPFLADIYFKRSIVFLTEHNEKGTVGFVLNKPVKIPVNEVLEDFPETEAEISLGGPVGTNTIHYIHTLGDQIPNSVKVYKNIYWGGDFDTVKSLVKSGLIQKDQIRFFVGYAGWKPKQLENEISENSWVISELPPKIIMKSVDDDIWKTTLKEMGKKYKLWANFPENPGMN